MEFVDDIQSSCQPLSIPKMIMEGIRIKIASTANLPYHFLDLPTLLLCLTTPPSPVNLPKPTIMLTYASLRLAIKNPSTPMRNIDVFLILNLVSHVK